MSDQTTHHAEQRVSEALLSDDTDYRRKFTAVSKALSDLQARAEEPLQVIDPLEYVYATARTAARLFKKGGSFFTMRAPESVLTGEDNVTWDGEPEDFVSEDKILIENFALPLVDVLEDEAIQSFLTGIATAHDRPLDLEGIVRTPLRDTQKLAITRMDSFTTGYSGGCTLTDGTGNGKSLALLSLIAYQRKVEKLDHHHLAIIVTRKGIVPHWLSEPAKHFEPAHRPKIHYLKDKNTNIKSLLATGVDTIVVTYDFLRNRFKEFTARVHTWNQIRTRSDYSDRASRQDSDDWSSELGSPWSLSGMRPVDLIYGDALSKIGYTVQWLGADEAHTCKNPAATVSVALAAANRKRYIGLTATPMTTDWTDAYHVVSSPAEAMIHTPDQFMRLFANPVQGLQVNHVELSGPPQGQRLENLVTMLRLTMCGSPKATQDLPECIGPHFATYELPENILGIVEFFGHLFIQKSFIENESNRSTDLVDKPSRGQALKFAYLARCYSNSTLLVPALSGDNLATIKEGHKLVQNFYRTLRQRLQELKRQHEDGQSGDQDFARLFTSGADDNTMLIYLASQHDVNTPGLDRALRAFNGVVSEEDDAIDDDDEERSIQTDFRDEMFRNTLTRKFRSDPELFYSPKVRKIIDILLQRFEGSQGGQRTKAVIMSSSLRFLDIIAIALRNDVACQREGLDQVYEFNGRLTDDQRADVLARWKDPESKGPLLITAGSGGEGIDLSAGNHLIETEPSWTKAAETQHIGRLHRPGQTQIVYHDIIVCESSYIDKIVRSISARKGARVRDIMRKCEEADQKTLEEYRRQN